MNFLIHTFKTLNMNDLGKAPIIPNSNGIFLVFVMAAVFAILKDGLTGITYYATGALFMLALVESKKR